MPTPARSGFSEFELLGQVSSALPDGHARIAKLREACRMAERPHAALRQLFPQLLWRKEVVCCLSETAADALCSL